MSTDQSVVPLDVWASLCWPLLAVRPGTLREYQALYRRNIQPVFGTRALDEISKQEIQAWILSLRPAIGKASLPVLKTLYREANDYGFATTNPTVGIKKKPHIPARRDFITWPVLNGLDLGRYNNLARFIALHGLRWSECRHLEAADIFNGYVHITKSADGLPTKSGRERKVPYLGYFDEFPRSYKWFRITLHREAGVTIHSLRYTFAHMLKSQGIHPQVAQKLLGHASIVMTIDLYSRVLPDELDAAGQKLREMLGEDMNG